VTVTFTALSASLRTEVKEIHASLDSVAEALSFPLDNLVRDEISNSAPFVRAGAVLAAAYHDVDDDYLREQRICLAAALEMLHIALNIHKLLLPVAYAQINSVDQSVHTTTAETEGIQQTERLVMGSTILAGDYCFSRSADMATKTGNPEVVNIFAEALKSVSEAHLRSLFDNSVLSIEEANTILVAGIKAASKLTDASNDRENAHIEISKMLLGNLQSADGQNIDGQNIDSQTAAIQNILLKYADTLTKPQIARWREIIGWLTS